MISQPSTKDVLLFAGGMDSTAMLCLAKDRKIDPAAVVMADTGNEHPVTLAYVQYVQDKLGFEIQTIRADFTERLAKRRESVLKTWPDKGIDPDRIAAAAELLKPTGIPYLDLCLLKGRFPAPGTRSCTEELKTIPIQRQVLIPLVQAGHRVRSWQGMREDENTAKVQLEMEDKLDLGIEAYRPLYRWSAKEVLAIHKRHGIEPNPLYKAGMWRVSCSPCMRCSKDELRETALRYPEAIEKVRQWEAMVSQVSPRGAATYLPLATYHPAARHWPAERVRAEAGIDSAVNWSQTVDHSRQQMDLIRTHLTDPDQCRSHYGLCE